MRPPLRVGQKMTKTNKPRVIYDGDCEFCRRWIKRWEVMTGDRVAFIPFQKAAKQYPNISPQQWAESIHFIGPDGTMYQGAAAVFAALRQVSGKKWLWRCYQHLPLFASISQFCYRRIARHRRLAAAVTTLLWGSDLRPATFQASRFLFMRLLGLVALIAMISLWSQVDGLIGSAGILPAEAFLETVKTHVLGDTYLQENMYFQFPTLCWISTSDSMLHGLCAIGVVASILLIANLAPGVMSLIFWLVYLSLVVVGQAFLSFQWDILLLETLFMSLFWAPWHLCCRADQEARSNRIGRWLLWLLLFKLMFLSGVTKLLSGDPAWFNLTALNVHYFTQPLPNAISWYAHQLPSWFQKTSVAIMFIIEIAAPFLIFCPRRPRALGALALIMLQVLIAATGNYCFFNLLTTVLCIPLLDDKMLRSFTPGPWTERLDQLKPAAAGAVWMRVSVSVVAVVIIFISILTFFDEMVRTQRNQQRAVEAGLERESVPAVFVAMLDASDTLLLQWSEEGRNPLLTWVRPFRTISGYGLFRDMTTERIEIIIQGSPDGITWRDYEFHWKPGDLARAPGVVVPHQPRLDWQMWFAPLNLRGSAHWLDRLVGRLLEGSPPVLELLAENPFPDQLPRLMRMEFYRYKFTSASTGSETGEWWSREYVGRTRGVSAR